MSKTISPRAGSKQFAAIKHFANKPFSFSEIQQWAIKQNGARPSRGYWSVNLTDYRYGLLTRFATKHANGLYTFNDNAIAAVNSVL